MYQKEELNLMVSSIKKTHVFIPFMRLFLYMDPESNWARVYVEQYLFVAVFTSHVCRRNLRVMCSADIRGHPQISFSNTVLVTWPLWNVNPRLCGGGHGR